MWLSGRLANTTVTPSDRTKMVQLLSKTATDDENCYIRAVALSLLAENAPSESSQIVSDCLTDPDPLVRTEAVRAAGNLKDASFVPAVLKLLIEDADVSVRRVCPAALTSIVSSQSEPPPEVTEALGSSVLRDEEDAVKFAAREALKKLLKTDEDNLKKLLEEFERKK